MSFSEAIGWWHSNYYQYKQYKPQTCKRGAERMARATLQPELVPKGTRIQLRGALGEVLVESLIKTMFSPQDFYTSAISSRNHDHRGWDINISFLGQEKLGIDVKTRGIRSDLFAGFYSLQRPDFPIWRVRVSPTHLGVFDIQQEHRLGNFRSPQEFMEQRVTEDLHLKNWLSCLQDQAGHILATKHNLNGAGDFLESFASINL
jgi:hypothetical protein